jgi:diacylglycerol kinase (ATP)
MSGHQLATLSLMTDPPFPTWLIGPPPDQATKRAALDAAIAGARAAGHALAVRTTSRAGDAGELAAEAARSGVELVIAAGGDGTINEVVNGLMRVSRPPRLGIVPLGTANDFARTLDLPSHAGAALRVALHGVAVELDVAIVNARYFINVSTGGFGADATKSAPRGAKRVLGPLAYAASGVKRLLGLRPYRGEFICDGYTVHSGGFIFFAVGNARRTGGGARVTPRADMEDRRLDAMIMRAVDRIELLSLLPDLRAGTHLEHPDVLYHRALSFEVRPALPTPVNADGERVTGVQYVYRASGRNLRVMFPAAIAAIRDAPSAG